MKFRTVAAALCIAAGGISAAIAQHQPMHHGGAAGNPDPRQMVDFPPEMQVNFLGNMRDHMQTIDAMVQSIAAGDYSRASKISAERLGLDSPSAAGCKPKSTANASEKPKAPMSPAKPMTMDEMMEAYMPEAMRDVGFSMHTAASEFSKVAMTGDRDATMKALGQVTQNCVACHSAYRIR